MLGFSGTREWVYPQSIKGKFTTIRRWTFLALHLILFVTPWIKVGGYPLLLIDLPARRVFLFGGTFTASDTFFLLLLTLFLAVAVFGLGGPFISIGAPKLISAWFGPRERGTAMGLYMTAPSIGTV